MAVIVRDTFTGYVAPPTSGAAMYTAVDNEVHYHRANYYGPATVGDKVRYTLNFPEGDVTFECEWTVIGTLTLRRISTIPGTNNGTAVLRTFTGSSTSKPQETGNLIRMGLRVNRGVVNGQTTIHFQWHGRSGTGSLDQTTDNVLFDGELTPTSANFVISGSSFRNRPNLQGRTPDGGGNPSLAIGEWKQVMGWDGNTPSPAEQLGIESDEILRPQLGTFGDTLYVIDGLSPSSDQMASIWNDFDDGFPAFLLSVRCIGNWWDGTLNGYILFGFYNDDGTTELDLYKFSGGVATDLLGWVTISTPINTILKYSLRATGDLLEVLVEDVVVFDETDTEHVVGSGGIGGYRTSTLNAGLEITAWEFDAVILESGCGDEISRHEFATPETDVDGSLMTNGVLERHPSSAGTVDAVGGTARKVGAGRATYLGRDIVGLGANYCVEVRGRFPGRDTGSSNQRTMIWEDEFTAMGLGAGLNGRVHDGGSAGVGTWTRVLADEASIDGPEVVGDGEGRVMQPAGSVGLFSNVSAYRVNNIVLPQDYDYEIDLYNSSQLYGKTGAIVRWQEATNFLGNYRWHVFQHQSVGPYRNSYHAGCGDQPLGALTTVSMIGGPGATREFETRVRGTNPGIVRVYFGGARDFADGVEEIVFYDGQFGPRLNYNGGSVGLWFEEDGAGEVNPLRVAGVRIYEYILTPGTPALERAVMSAGVRYDAAVQNGYRLDLEFDHTGPSTDGTLKLKAITAGAEQVLKSWPILIGHDTEQSIVLKVTGTLLGAQFNGVDQGTFNAASELPEDAGAVPDYATGFPAMAIEDEHPGLDLHVERMVVYSAPDEVPCIGPPSNPYPTEPPPIPTDVANLHINKFGAFREISRLQEWRGGQFRDVYGEVVPDDVLPFWSRGQFRPVIFFDGDTIPEPDTEFPPYYDPCNRLPPIVPPGAIDPLTGRFFGMSAAPPSVMGPLFTGTQIALGGWTPGQLAQFAANGWKLVTGQGSRNNYLLNGRFDKDAFIAGTIAKVGPVYAAISGYTASSYVGHSMVDDFNSTVLWPPSGISPADMLDIRNTLKGMYPNIRWGTRAFPSQFPSNLGFEFYSAQYRYNLGSAFAWAAQQYALCQAWGAYLILDLNYLHGGNGSSGIRYANGTVKGQGPNNWFMSPAEVQSYFLAMYAGAQSVDVNVPLLIGSKGYQYYPPFLAQPGMLDALVNSRNGLAALP